MKHKLLFLALLPAVFLSAQNSFENFMQQINSNNQQIEAAKKLITADNYKAYTDIYLPNPQIGYEYISIEEGALHELVVSQSFDFPSTYFQKRTIASYSERQTDIAYRQLKRDVLSEAVELYAERIYLNRKTSLYEGLDLILDTLYKNMEKSLQIGDVNILEANRIRSEITKNRVALVKLTNQIRNNSQQLALLNGGINPEVNNIDFPLLSLPQDPDSLKAAIINNHPLNEYWTTELEKSNLEIKLMQSSSLPGFEVGYKQVRDFGVIGNGFVAGMTIPLFENKNTVKEAKARKNYLESENISTLNKLETTIQSLINNYNVSLESMQYVNDLEASLTSPDLLWKAYNLGEINYSEFFMEYVNYRDTYEYAEDIKKQAFANMLLLHVLLKY